MAEVEKHTETFIVMVLTDLEAGTLRTVLRLIGGPPSGPRGQLNSIETALGVAGVETIPLDSSGGLAVGLVQ